MKLIFIAFGITCFLVLTSCASATPHPQMSISIDELNALILQYRDAAPGSLAGIVVLALILGLVSMVYFIVLANNFFYYLSIHEPWIGG